MKRTTYLLGVRWLSLPISLIASGCASTPRPAVLDDARVALQAPETRELVALRPAMLEAAQGYGLAAEQAFDKGDVAQARRYAELVLQRVHAAENFVARDAAAEQAKIMATRLANMDKEVDRDRKELTRLQALDEKIAKITAAAGDGTVATDPALDNARKQLVAARRKQAEAIGAGARSLARDKYEQGVALLEASVVALEMKLAADATTATTAAIVAFTAAIESATEAKSAMVSTPSSTPAERVVVVPRAESIADDVEMPRKNANRALSVAISAKANAIGQNAEMASPAAFAQGRALLDSAESRFDRGDYESAIALAKNATLAFERAGNAASAASSTPSATPGENTPLAPGQTASTTPRSMTPSIVRVLIHEAEDAKADAIARGAQGSTAMAYGTYLLELAEKAIAEGDSARAIELAKDARKSFGLATAPQATAPNGPGAKPAAQIPAITAIAAAPPITKGTLSKANAAERDAAIVAIVAAQQALADATGRDHPEAKRKKAQSLITIAEGWLDRDGFVQAKAFAESAQKELVPEPPRPTVAEKPIVKAQTERRVEERPAAERRVAERSVEERPVEEKPVTERTIVKQVVVQPVVEERHVREPVVEKIFVESPSRAPRSTNAHESHQDWQEPYRKVIEALTLRDKVKGLATTPAAKTALATGMEKLAAGQAAWSRRDYQGARESADSAIAFFYTILSPSTSPVPDAASEPNSVAVAPSEDVSAQRDSTSYRKAESLVREATTLVEVCEHEKCAERNVGLFASGKAAVTSARVALEAGRYEIATELAKEAKIKLQASLDTPKSTNVPVVDSEAQKKRRIAAEDAIREANVQHQLCEQKKCTGKDIESWLRAESSMGAARAAFADSEFDRAKTKADDATNILKAAFAAQAALPEPKEPPHIEIPPDITNVVARGNSLIVTPAFDFTSGSSTLTPASSPSIDTLAKVLLHNKDRIRSISVIGFTDNRGAAALNVSLSQQRAKAVADGLIAAGVSSSIVTSLGRGPEDPIADNATASGRSANRRVEIRIEFMDDGK